MGVGAEVDRGPFKVHVEIKRSETAGLHPAGSKRPALHKPTVPATVLVVTPTQPSPFLTQPHSQSHTAGTSQPSLTGRRAAATGASPPPPAPAAARPHARRCRAPGPAGAGSVCVWRRAGAEPRLPTTRSVALRWLQHASGLGCVAAPAFGPFQQLRLPDCLPACRAPRPSPYLPDTSPPSTTLRNTALVPPPCPCPPSLPMNVNPRTLFSSALAVAATLPCTNICLQPSPAGLRDVLLGNWELGAFRGWGLLSRATSSSIGHALLLALLHWVWFSLGWSLQRHNPPAPAPAPAPRTLFSSALAALSGVMDPGLGGQPAAAAQCASRSSPSSAASSWRREAGRSNSDDSSTPNISHT